MFTKSINKKYFALLAGSLMILLLASRAAGHLDDRPFDIREFAKNSDFIFKGRVINVEYRNSEAVPVRDPTTGKQATEEGLPVFQDGSDLPHTFVTLFIEKIYKGKAPEGPVGGPPSDMLTLRFVGGAFAQDDSEIIFVDTYPLFDVGDVDVLFVERNTIKACPLYRSGLGRFRVINPDPQNPRQVNMIYNEDGQEILFVPDSSTQNGEIATGAYHKFEEVMQNTIGSVMLFKEGVDPENEYSLPGEEDKPEPDVPRGEQFTEAFFDVFVQEIVAEVHTPDELDRLPPVISADINLPFIAEPLTHDPPRDFGPEIPEDLPRPWLDELPEAERELILEAERAEAEMSELAGDNPVLPETECDLHILRFGPLAGDLSGPNERPDCRVDLFDFEVVARLWLACNDPADESCLN